MFDSLEHCLEVIELYNRGLISATKALATIEHWEYNYVYCEISGQMALEF